MGELRRTCMRASAYLCRFSKCISRLERTERSERAKSGIIKVKISAEQQKENDNHVYRIKFSINT